jgi:hypothetical protein
MKIFNYRTFILNEDKRFEVGGKLSDTEKKEVYKTLKDAYKVNKRPYTIEEDSNGRERLVWLENPTDYMVTSDITNRKLRWFIELPDGRTCHPTELYFNIKKAEMDMVQSNIEYHSNQAKIRYETVYEALKKSNEINSVVDSIKTAIKYGFELKKIFNSDDIGQNNPNVILSKKDPFDSNKNMIFTVPEYHINRGETYMTLNEDDVLKFKNNERTQDNKWLHYTYSEMKINNRDEPENIRTISTIN